MKFTLAVALLLSAFCLNTNAQTNLSLGDDTTATASSTFSAGYPASAVIDGDRKGTHWGAGGGWNDSTRGVFPDSLAVTLKRSFAVQRVVVFTVQNDFSNPVEPTPTQTCTLYGVKDFSIETLDADGVTWTTQATVLNNTLCKREVVLPVLVRTSGVRIVVNASHDGLFSRIVELEVFSR